MLFIRCAVVGVLMALHLWTDSWCLYIPDTKATAPSAKIQICGNALTTFIIEACDGAVSSFNQVSSSRENVPTQITEDCCNQECSMEYLQNYCGDTLLFSINNIRSGKGLSKNFLKALSSRGSPSEFVPNERASGPSWRRKGSAEVRFRVRNKNGGRRESEILGVNRRKRKRSFKRKCAYKSFGHYLLKLDRAHRARPHVAKTPNNINRTWPSIQIGTVSPEIDKFGGQPIVVVKNRSNSV